MNLEKPEATLQLMLSKRLIERYSEYSIDSIAFPFGFYNEDVIRLAKEAGYRYLIGAGSVEHKFENDVFPRVGVLSATSYARNILSINKSFDRFGF